MQRTAFPVLLSMLLLGALVACGGPVGPFAGGRLSGEIGDAAAGDWSFADDVENAQLETRPTDPYSVNTWFVGIGPALYVPTSMILGPKDPSDRGWVVHVADDPAVRIRLGERVFERTAVRVEGAEYDRARSALEARYALDPAERDPERIIWIYRLDPRARS